MGIRVGAPVGTPGGAVGSGVMEMLGFVVDACPKMLLHVIRMAMSRSLLMLGRSKAAPGPPSALRRSALRSALPCFALG